MVKTLKEIPSICPEHVVVIGGGRWARVYLEVLCSFISPSVKLSVHSPRNSESMLKWASVCGLAGRIQVFSRYPPLTGIESS